MRKGLLILLIVISSILMQACQHEPYAKNIKSVGLLLSGTINEEIWGAKGYKALINIGDKYHVHTYYREKVATKEDVIKALNAFKEKNVNLVFGHGSEFANLLMEVKDKYPKMHFITINGSVSGKGISSLHFEGKAMGFFGGMVAAKMSKTGVIGIIAAFPWQPEVDGFVEGALYQRRDIRIKVDYVKNWNDVEKAKELLNKMIDKKADVFYPAGDGYNIPVMEDIKKHNLYAIGYVSDQSNIGQKVVLTSTVQNVTKIYMLAADKFNSGMLESGNLYYDFGDGVISMGKYSELVPKSFQNHIQELINQYKKDNRLPYETD